MRQPFSIQSNTSIRTTFANPSYYYTKGAPSIPYFNFRSKSKIVHFLLYFYNKNYNNGGASPLILFTTPRAGGSRGRRPSPVVPAA